MGIMKRLLARKPVFGGMPKLLELQIKVASKLLEEFRTMAKLETRPPAKRLSPGALPGRTSMPM